MERQPKNPTARGPGDRFTGDVYIDPIAQGHGATPISIALVRFTPGARTAWHNHSVGQTLFVTEGEGRVQARGQSTVTLRPGDTVFAPAGEWHWHGAAPEHYMTHLAISEGTPEWGDHVDDADYHRGA